jgi:hypothetical protein
MEIWDTDCDECNYDYGVGEKEENEKVRNKEGKAGTDIDDL